MYRTRFQAEPGRPDHEHPVKSISLGIIGGPGRAFNGFALESFVTVMDDCMQSLPPTSGTNASALIEYRTSPPAGTENEIFPDEKTPKLGLLAGSISVYCAQLVFEGAPTGQPVDESTERLATDAPSAGIVTGKAAPPFGVTV